MATNPWISKNSRSEQGLYEDLVIESLKFYGEDVYYLPRELVNKDVIFGDDVPSRFTDAYKIEMYIENTEGFAGEGDLFSKFGFELRDQATFVVARKRWKNLIGSKLDAANFRPREGDIIYLPMSHSMFEIYKVETETPFYQLSQLPTFRLQCELFEYNDEDFDTGLAFINQIEEEGAYQYKIPLMSKDSSDPVVTSTLGDQGAVSSFSIVSSPGGFLNVPNVIVDQVDSDNSKFGITSLNVGEGRSKEGQYLFTSIEGFAEVWVYPAVHPSTGQQALFKTGGLVVGIDNNGYMGYAFNDDTSFITPGNVTLNTGQWNHILIGMEYSGQYKLYAYVNGVKAVDVGVPMFTFLSSSGYAIGAAAAGTTPGGIEFASFDGWLDDFRAVAQRRDGAILSGSIVGDNYNLPDTEFDSEAGVAFFDNFNGRRATVIAGIEEGRLVNLLITDSGEGYNSAPGVTVEGLATGGTFERGEIVTQSHATYDVTGEVVAWNDSDNVLYLAHVGSTDGRFHEFNNQYLIVGENASYLPSLVDQLQNIQQGAQNDVFDDFENDFLDFSESNPFGDIS